MIHGLDLRDMTPAIIDDIFSSFGELVFARLTRDQKATIKEMCRSRGAVVAVTDDTDNDSPWSPPHPKSDKTCQIL